MKKIIFGILFLLGVVIGGIYYWYWQSLKQVATISQSGAMDSQAEMIESQPASKPQKADTPLSKDHNTHKLEEGSNSWVATLVMGTDDYGSNEVARTDSIMLVFTNVNTRRVSVISIPRDTRVNLQGVGLTKINHANVVGVLDGGVHKGTMESVKAASNLLGITINYYVKINFQGFQKAVDAVGGIDVNIPYSINDDFANAHFQAGENHLTGEEALYFAQSRHGVPRGDFDRQKDQFLLISALAQKLLRLPNIPRLPSELKIINEDLIDTNLPVSQVLSLGLALKGIKEDEIKYYQLPGHGITAHDPLVGAELYYYEPDMDGVRKIVQEALK